MPEIEHIVTEYTAKLGDAGTTTIRYSGPPLSQLPESQAKFVRGLMVMFEEVTEPIKIEEKD